MYMRDKILIVDDIELNREILSEILENDFSILEADNGSRALELVHKYENEITVILLDLVMPGMDGFEVLKRLHGTDEMKNIPVLIISGEGAVDVERRCFELGIYDFIRKPFDSTLVRRRVKNIAELFIYKNYLEETVERQTERLRKQYNKILQQSQELKKTNDAIIDILGNVVEYRNLESGEHIQRVKGYTRILANEFMKRYPEYGLNQNMVDVIVSASSLHDIGKIAIPDNILLKPGKLTQEEFEVMKTHTTKGCEIIENIKDCWNEEYTKISYEICRHHHERYDGRGYPDQLKGDDIPISAQLVSVADVYDALVNERCYKAAFTANQAYDMITGGECGIFSPKLLECFKKCRDKFEDFAKQRIR